MGRLPGSRVVVIIMAIVGLSLQCAPQDSEEAPTRLLASILLSEAGVVHGGFGHLGLEASLEAFVDDQTAIRGILAYRMEGQPEWLITIMGGWYGTGTYIRPFIGYGIGIGSPIEHNPYIASIGEMDLMLEISGRVSFFIGTRVVWDFTFPLHWEGRAGLSVSI